MRTSNFMLPKREASIIWRYLDGVSRALARRFSSGSSPGEENLTFLLCELLDEGTTGLHLLDYPLSMAKNDLANSDGGISLDVTFNTHEYTKHVEHHYSGADLGVCFVTDHPLFGRSEKAVLLQAKRLFPDSNSAFTLQSTFNSFRTVQLEFLKELEHRFSALNSIYYLWYSPSSSGFSQNDAMLVRALEASAFSDWTRALEWHPFLEDLIEFGRPWNTIWSNSSQEIVENDDPQKEWRETQPATRVSSLSVVDSISSNGRGPSLASLYESRTSQSRRRKHHILPFEPFAELFFIALVSERIGSSNVDWLRLARGEKVPMPPPKSCSEAVSGKIELPESVPGPRHTLTFTLRSTLHWPETFRAKQ